MGTGLEVAGTTSSERRWGTWRAAWRLGAGVLVLLDCTSGPSGACELWGDCERANVTDAGRAPPGASAGTSTCGDGVLDPGEECDDGSACADGRSCTDDRFRCDGSTRASCQPRGGDGCSAACTREPGPACDAQSAGSGGCVSGETPAPEPLEDTAAGAAPPGVGGGDAGGSAADDGARDESDTEPEPPRCTWSDFGAPAPVTGLELGITAGLSLWGPALSPDGQTIYFAASPEGGAEAMFTAKRSGTSRASEALRLVALESGRGEGTPFVSFDGLRLYFYSERDADGDRDLWLATRSDVTLAFGEPRSLPGINTTAPDHLPWLSRDELTLLFVSSRTGGLGQSDIWLATRPTRAASFIDARPLDGINTAQDEGRAVMSRDGLTLFFTSSREGGQGAHDIWMATRADSSTSFGPARNVSVLNSPARDLDPFLSANERELWFASDRSGVVALWRAVRECT